MNNSNPQLVYVKSLLTSKIFWTQVLAAAAMLATMFGLHPAFLNPDNQVELVGLLTAAATVGFRIWGTNGPVSFTAPVSTPAAQTLPPGVHTVTVTPPPPPVPPTVVTINSAPLPAPAVIAAAPVVVVAPPPAAPPPPPPAPPV